MPAIIDSDEFNEALEIDSDSDPLDISSHAQPTGSGMEFHVKMDSYTLHGVEDMIVHTAAKQLISGYGDASLKKRVEEAAAEMLSQKINSVLEGVAKDIMDQPMTPKFPGSKSEPVTLREFVGLCGREYLSQQVDREGNPASGRYGGNSPRVEFIISSVLNKQFKAAIDAATSEIRKEAAAAIEARLKSMIDDERKRIADAVGFEIKRSR